MRALPVELCDEEADTSERNRQRSVSLLYHSRDSHSLVVNPVRTAVAFFRDKTTQNLIAQGQNCLKFDWSGMKLLEF